ncbi:MAG TPA: type IV toxin-antitoxin system AbiEi family antitoxin [Ilumatobacteraceae bacterium]|nr:type IV toxin-antitoxin system AbiEi family antitoxin [Ilumatobacteraceae bacterium]
MAAAATITTTEAAKRLTVSTQRLRQLIIANEIHAERHGPMWAIDSASVEEYSRHRRPTAGRSLSTRMVWAALLSDLGTDVDDEVIEAFGLGRTEQARLRALRERDANEWRWLARRRARVQRFETFDAYLDRIEHHDGVLRTGMSALADHAVDLVANRRTLDVYASASAAAALIDAMRLTPAATGNLTIRAIDDFGASGFVLDRDVMPRAVVAVDLLDDADTRTSRAGSDLIEAITCG